MAQEMPEKLGRYKIVRELGKGAMGIVYEGLDPNIGRRVAIKTARRDVMEATGLADEMMERFLREARAAGGLNHPNIITIYDAGEENDIAFIAMEFLEGHDLADELGKKRRYTAEEAVRIGATVCRALAMAHQQGVVHRDVKPANILVMNDGTLKVADFGIARVSDSNLTQDGAMIGTPHYMSPEQFMGQRVDGRSDLFSVGIIIYELLTGEKPFTGEALSTVMHNALKSDPVPPHELNYAVPECLSLVVMKALSKQPQKRYQDGLAMADALEESLQENPNPSITQVGGALESLAATVAASPDSPTVIAPSASQLDSTVGGETVVSTPPERPQAPAPKMPERAEGKSAPPPVGSSKMPLFIGAVALVAIAGIVAALLLSGGGSRDTQTPEGYYFSAIRPYIKAHAEETPLENATILLYYPGTEEPIEEIPISKEDYSERINLDHHYKSLKGMVQAPGYENNTFEVSAAPSKAGDFAAVPVDMIPVGN